MASVTITIKDVDTHNIGVDVNLAPNFPESALLYTNAQLIAKDVLAFIQQIGNQINNKQHRQVMTDALSI